MRFGLRSVLCVSVVGILSQASGVSADMIVGAPGAAVFPPPGAVYDSSSPPVTYGAIPVSIGHVRMHDPSSSVPYPPVGASINSFFDIFTELSVNGGGIWQPAPAPATVHLNGLPPGVPYIGNFSTEMLQLDLHGGTMPAGVMIRESPTLQSTGQTRISDEGGGQYRIGSFFDIFTELSVDGGQSWIPASGPVHVELGLPEPASASLLALGSVALLRRRK